MAKGHAALLFVCPFSVGLLCFAWLIYYRLVSFCCGNYNGNVENAGRGWPHKPKNRGYIPDFSPKKKQK